MRFKGSTGPVEDWPPSSGTEPLEVAVTWRALNAVLKHSRGRGGHDGAAVDYL